MSWDPPNKTIDDIVGHSVEDARAAKGFSLPAPDALTFRREDLILSIGRTQMLSMAHSKMSRAARFRLVRDVSVAVMTHMDIFVDAPSERFAFTKLLDELADEERTSLASKVGAAVADLAMDRSGYRFRANARELDFSKAAGSTSRKIPDFLYDDGKGDETTPSRVVVVEAKGSLSKFRATKARLSALANKAYEEQVRNFVGEKANGIPVAGGCVAAFGAIPGRATATLVVRAPGAGVKDPQPAGAVASSAGGAQPYAGVARSLSAAASSPMQEPVPMPQQEVEQEYDQQAWRKKPRTGWSDYGGGGGGGGGRRRDGERESGPHGRIAFANYETVFQLCGATDAARAIRSSLDGVGEQVTPEAQVFYVLASDERFLVGSFPFAPCWSQGSFAVYRPAAEAILEFLADNRSSPPGSVAIPMVPPNLWDDDHQIALQGDGLAWLSRLTGPVARRTWDLSAGRWREPGDV